MLTSLKHETGKPMRIEQIPVPKVRPTDCTGEGEGLQHRAEPGQRD